LRKSEISAGNNISLLFASFFCFCVNRLSTKFP
jgi:hypothetical protein